MNNLQNQVGFFDYGAEQEEIARRRALAERLRQDSQTPLDTGRMVGNVVAPVSPLAGVAKMLQAYNAREYEDQAKRDRESLNQRYQKDLASVLQRGMQAQTGTPGSTETIVDETADGGMGRSAQINAPAVAPNMAEAASTYMSHPATQQLGMQLMQKNAESAALARALQGVPGGGGFVAGPGGAPSLPPLSLLSAGPAGVKVWEQLAQQNKPIPLREGDLVVPDGQGGFKSVYTQPKLEPGMQPVRSPNGQVTGAEAIPGYAQGRGAIARSVTGAQEGARAELDLVTVPDGRGGTVQMPRSQAVNQLGTPPQGGKTALAMDSLMQEVQTQLANAQRAPDQGSRDMALRLANEAAAQLKRMGANVNVPELTGRGIGTTGPKEEETYKGERSKGFVKQAEELRAGWQKANSSLQNLDRLETLLSDPNIAKGAMADTLSGMKNLAASFGVDIKGLPAEQAITALTNEMALQARNPAGGAGMPGAMSDQDRSFLANMQPGLSKSPEGRKMIIQTMRKLAERERDIAKMANEYERKNGRLDANFERELYEFAEKNPLFSAPASGGGKFRVIR